MTSLDLFTHAALHWPDRYPEDPGHRGIDTSIAAAQAMKSCHKTLRATVLVAIRNAGSYGATTNELVELTGIPRDSLQPRTSELRADGKIIDSGKRRRNANKKLAIVWTTKGEA